MEKYDIKYAVYGKICTNMTYHGQICKIGHYEQNMTKYDTTNRCHFIANSLIRKDI